jgi:TonB-dependent starch-binding outer membrane protein SusC
MKRYICSLLLTIMFVCYGYAQTTIKGVVKDEKGETLPGASVFVKGTSNGAVTDANGAFSLKISDPQKDILKITFVGMEELEFPLDGRTEGIVITLSANVKEMDEVVVIGYGAMKRKDLTGAVSSLSSDKIKDVPVASVDEALTGRLAGVLVQSSDGSPDAGINIRVRGGTSITQGNDPLYVVDGFIVRSISNISMRDVQSIDVLKDAASTAIYGAEGANGVVLITTKGAEKGKITVNFNSYYGSQRPYNLPRALSPYEYVYYQRELDQGTSFSNMYGLWSDVNIYKSQKGVDWVNKMFNHNVEQKNYNLSIAGGSDNVKTYLSLSRNDQDYIMNTSHRLNDNFNFKVDWDVNKALKVSMQAKLSNIVIDGPGVSGGNLLGNCVQYASAYSLSQLDAVALEGADDISLEAQGNIYNPIASIEHDYKKQTTFETSYLSGITWKIFKWLTYDVKGSLTFNDNKNTEIYTKGTGTSANYGGYPVATKKDDNKKDWYISNTLSMNFDFKKKGRLSGLLGQDARNLTEKYVSISCKYYPMDMTADQILAMWNYGTPDPVYTYIYEPTRSASYFGRINYELNNKYLFSATTRLDGKNVFAPGNRWGFFPGFSAGWRINEESFFKIPAISLLKLRLSYGEVGNAKVESYWRQEWSFIDASTSSNASKLAYFDEDPANAMQTASTMYNDKLKWESKISRNLGLDFGLFNDKITGTVEVYKETTKNLILKMSLPSSSGYSYQYQNIGQVSNHGVEITLNGNILRTHDFLLSANFNITFNRNNIDKYTAPYATASAVSYSIGTNEFYIQEGKPLGQFYGFVSDGAYTFDDFYFNPSTKGWVAYDGVPDFSQLISQNYGPGHVKVKDLDGDKVITTTGDKTVIGCAQPKHYGGFGFNARWKSFDISTLFNWTYGNDIFNASKMMYNHYNGSKKYQNVTETMALGKRFTIIDPETGNNIFSGTYANPERLKELNKNSKLWSPVTNYNFPCSWAVEDGSFLRMSSLTVGYTLPQNMSRKLFITNFRVYATLYNVFCLTNYSGQDPEVSVKSSNPLTPGIDYSAYPRARNFVIGANLTF